MSRSRPSKYAPQWRVYELVDPRPNERRRFVDYGRGEKPWHRIKAKEGSTLDRWLKELQSLGMQPMRNWANLPSTIRFTRDDAKAICRFHRQMLTASGFHMMSHKKLNFKRTEVGRIAGRIAGRRAVTLTRPDGTVEQFESQAEAARLTGINKSVIAYRCKVGKDRHGNKWEIAKPLKRRRK